MRPRAPVLPFVLLALLALAALPAPASANGHGDGGVLQDVGHHLDTTGTPVWAGDAVYLFGGTQCGGRGNAYACVGDARIHRYDPRDGSVRLMGATLPTGRWDLSGVWTGDAVYLFGGVTRSGPVFTDQILRYDPRADSVTVMGAVLPTPRQGVAAAFDGRDVHLFGGQGSETDCAPEGACVEAMRYRVAQDRLETAGILPQARFDATAVMDGGSVLLFGGRGGYGVRAPEVVDVLRYHPATGAFEAEAAQPHAFAGPAFPHPDGWVLVGAGTYLVDPDLEFNHTVRRAALYHSATRSFTNLSALLPASARGLTTDQGPLLLAEDRVLRYDPAADVPYLVLPPGVVLNVTATPGPGLDEVTIRWEPPMDDGGAPILGYAVFHETGTGEGQLVGETDGTSFVHRVYDGVERRTYFVEAVNEAGDGEHDAHVVGRVLAARDRPPLVVDAPVGGYVLAGDVVSGLLLVAFAGSLAWPRSRRALVGGWRAVLRFLVDRVPLAGLFGVALLAPLLVTAGFVLTDTLPRTLGDAIDAEGLEQRCIADNAAWQEKGYPDYAIMEACEKAVRAWYRPFWLLLWGSFPATFALAAVATGALAGALLARIRARDGDAQVRLLRLDDLLARGALSPGEHQRLRARMLDAESVILKGRREPLAALVTLVLLAPSLVFLEEMRDDTTLHTPQFPSNAVNPAFGHVGVASAIAFSLFLLAVAFLSWRAASAQRGHDAARARADLEAAWQSAVESGASRGPLAARAASDASLASRFQVERELGRGSLGRAVLAHDKRLDRKVVLKQPLAPWAMRDDSSRRAFLQEARLAARIQHPNVVTVHDVLADEEPPVLVLEHVPGGSLRDVLDNRKRLPKDEAVRVALGVLAGLQRIHEAGMVHRDVKPANVLLGTDGTPKVADFGIARPPPGYEATAVIAPAAGHEVGTPGYMSPEQARGDEADARSDLHAVGALLYEMLTGEHYLGLDARNAAQARRLAEEGNVRLPSPHVPPALEAFLRRALAKEPAERFGDAREMADALRAAVGKA